MHEFSTVEGFADITELMAEMIKYLANEPSIGLFYIQQHTQSAVPNVIRLRNNVSTKSHETTLHSQDSEDSISMVRSMKECGFPIADEMIRDIRKSLSIMSTKQPKRGLIRGSRSDLMMERASSWGPYNSQLGGEKSGYFSTVFKSAKKKATNLRWSQFDSREFEESGERALSVASGASGSSSLQDVGLDELPLSSQVTDEPREEELEVSLSSPSQSLVVPAASENYDEFKASKEAKLEEWLEGNGNGDDNRGVRDSGEA